MSAKSLCNRDNHIVALCDGADMCFDEQKKLCDGAKRSSYEDCCMHLCDNERCDSYIAREISAG